MKLKQSIFALVAMLSFTFSAFAQTVTTEADLKAALQYGGEVTLGASITVSSPVPIPNDAVVVLNLNGKTLKATNAKTKVLENQGKLTINGQGTVSGIIYNGTANGSAAEMTLNGGTYSLDGNSGGLHHYGKTLTINDGVVVKTTSYGVRMAGKGSVLNLKGGTYTSTGSGDMARPLALSNGTVNFLDSDITVNGYMHVMVGQVTVNFGENNQYSPFEAYHQGNSYASSVFYCKTLAEAISRTDFAAVTLVKNVKVADGAPITVNKEIDLNLNGKNLSATNAKTAVLKNYANMTIKGKGTVTGLVYNGDAENKGVAEMTLNGGTYKLDGANGGFFNYGKTLTVNDGVTISSQVYGLRMSNAASVINLNGGTFTSTNPTDNMKRAIAVDAGTINFNDDDITINGYFHANRSKAKVNFGEYCPFDAFMYSTTNASGYYVVNLENAINKADAGYEIVLQKNIERSEIVTLPKKVTLDGNGKTLTSTAGRAINVDCADVVTIENLTIAGATGCERGINIINKAGITNIDKVKVSGVSHYAVHVATSAGAAQVNIQNSDLTGYAAVAAYGEGGNVSVKNSNLVGINNYADNGSNSFCTIAVGSNVNVNVAGGSVKAVSQEGKAGQFVLGATADVTGASITADAELITEGTAEYFGININKNTVTVRKDYAGDYVTNDAGNGLVTLKAGVVAQIGNAKYATLPAAISAAKAGETVILLADVNLGNVTSSLSIKNGVVVNGQGYTVTINSVNESWNKAAFAPSGPASYTIKNLTVDLKNAADGMAAFSLKYGGTLENVTVKGAFGQAVSATMSSTVTVTNCAFDGATWGVYAIASNTKVNITGTAFNTTGAVYLHKYGELVFTGNMIAADSYIETEATVDVSKNFWNGNNATGSAPAAAQLKGGNIICDTYYATNSNGVLGSLTNNGVAEDAVINIEIDGETYAYGPSRLSLISKLLGSDAQGANVKITLLDDVALENGLQIAPYIESVDNIVAKAVEIDLNGKTLTGFIQINANVTATIQNGTVKNTNGSHSAIDVSGAVTLDKMTVESTTKAFKVADGATLAVKEGTYSSDPTSYVAENYVTVANNGVWNVVNAVAKIDDKGYATLQAAINAVQNNNVITLIADVAESVTLTEKAGLYYTIDGAGNTMEGSINVKALSDTEDNRRITIQNISFKDETAAEVDFITSVETNHYPRLTIKSCTFVGSGDATDVAVRLKSSHSVVISECIGTGLHSFLQNTSGWNLTLDRVQVYESKGAFALGTVQGVTVKGSTIDVATYGIRMDANTYNNNAVIEDNNVTAFIPVVVRKVNTQSNVTITGENTFTAENTDGKWMVIGTTEYEENGKLPAETAEGNVVVALNGDNLSYAGVHGAGLAGAGTAEAPYLINNVAELEIFRNSVNAGSAKYSKPGLYVALNADIDMTGVNWVGIGTATADHGFMGNFDGKNFKIKNLTIENPALDSDGYAYAGLFGVTEGTDKDNQNTIKNLIIENVTITTTGHIVSAAIAYPYYTIVDNVKVCGNIAITGGNYTAGVLAYTRRCVNASNLSIVGNDSSYVKGAQTVGGVISDIQMNGGLTAVYKNFSAENLAITGAKQVGGISGIISQQALDGATVKNVTLNCGDARVGIVAGSLGATSTISNVVSENVTGATAVVGATYDGAKAVEARIGDTYYATLDAALAAEGDEVELFVPVTVAKDETRVLDLKGKTVSHSKACTASYEMIKNLGILTIKNGTLSFTDTSAGDPSFGWGSYTINNYGTLVVEEGATIQHLGAQAFATHMIAAIQQAKGSTTINGGVISTPNYRSVRINGGALAINGGEFDGQVWLQPNQGDVTIAVNGGTFGPNGRDGSSIFMTNVGENKTITSASITGGTFTTKIGCSDAAALAGIITGGKFTEAAKENTNSALLATGFEFSNLVDGYHTVVDDPTTHYIATLDELKAFRDEVNTGANYYAGVTVYLAADIDMAGENWVGIGSATKDHGFMGNFDGQGYKIKNLTITDPALDSDDYAYAGLFGVTEGTDKNNQNTIKNLTIENVTITTTGHIAAAAIAYPYYTIVDNVKVCGNIKIQGGDYTAGVLAYTRRCVNASNLSIVGNEGSFVKGNKVVGGVISDIQMNGGLTADYKNFSAEGITVSGKMRVGGISGIIATQTLNGATVKNVTLNSEDKFAGVVAGCLGGTSTITNVVSENVTGATVLIGATYDAPKAVQAKIGDTYYATLEAALAAQGEATVELLAPVTVATGETRVLNLNGKTVVATDNATGSYAMITNKGDLTINGEGAIKLTATNNREWNAYSSVISNTVGGKLTVNGGTIEHLGGTDMAYAIDNLTNGKGTYAETIINGGTVKSTYRAIRQFLNGTEAQNILTVNGGTIEGANKSIWMQDPSANANTGSLSVAADAKLNGDVYLFVTAGSTEWPVSVSIAAVALQGESKVVTGNVPAGYELSNVNGTYGVYNGAAKIGTAYYATIAEAISAAQAGETVVLIIDVTATEPIAIPAGKKITLDLNGKTITGTDNETKSYGLININPGAELTINDAVGNGAIKLTATQNRGWNAYSSVISNQRGKLTVNGGTIEHLGGTDMAYAIDNLTNTGAQKAETVINGGVIKSTYRAIRQFLNSTSAENILTVNGGIIEGANKSIWMQDANKSANPGALTVAEDAQLKGDVYLFVTAGSTEWPVSVSIAADALQGESQITTGNVPAGYELSNINGTYSVYSGAAKIGNTYYETFDAAYKASKTGDVVTLLKTVVIDGGTWVNYSTKNITVKAAFGDAAFRVQGNPRMVWFGGMTIESDDYCIIVGAKDGSSGADVDIMGGTYKGATTAISVTKGSVNIQGGTFKVEPYEGSYDYTINCIDAAYNSGAAKVSIKGGKFYQFNPGNNAAEGAGTNFLTGGYAGKPEDDGYYSVVKAVAKIGKVHYHSIQAAFDDAKTDDVVTLLADVTYDDDDVIEGSKGKTMVEVAGKNITLDMNGKTINASYTGPNYLMSVIHVTDGAGLTVTGNGFINVNGLNAEGAAAKNIAYVFYKSGETGYLTIENGTFHMNDAADSMVYTNGDEIVTINGGTFILDAVASQTNGFPVIFNTAGNNERQIVVNGGTFNYDINHQIRPFEPYVAPEKAVKANGDGTWTVVPAEAYITEMLGGTVNEAGEWGHKVGYATIAEAIAAVNELGNKVSIAKDLELTEAVVVPADKTVVLDLNGKTVTMNDASGAAAALLKNNGNLTIMDGTEAKAGKLSFKTTTPSAANAYASNTISNYGVITIESGNVENLSVGGGACYALDNYAGSTATINGGKLTAEKTAVRIFNWTNGEEAKATINMNGGEIYSKNGYGINVNSGNAPFVALNITGGTITTDYADYKLAVYVVNKGTAENFTANVTGGTFNGIFALNGVTAQTMKQDAVAVSGGTFEGVTCYEDPAYGFVSGGTFKSAVDAKAVATGFICKDNGDGTFGVIVDPKHGMVAQIIRNDYYAENQYFATINDAVQAAVSGETVTLIANVETSAAGYTTITDDYAVIVAVKEKEITLDLNGKSVTVTPTAEELADAEGKMLMSVFGMDTNGKLTLTGNGSVKVNANGANVYSLAAAYGEGAQLFIKSGSYEADAVNANGSLIYAQQRNCITVEGGNFRLGNVGTSTNGSPWIFNTKGQNATGIKVVGGTYNADINHQFWADEVFVPEAHALKNNGDGTWTVVDAVAYTNEKATSRGAEWRHVGYASLEDAIAATGKYNCQDNTVTMIKDITLEPITVANGVKVAIDLNGKTISGTDNGTASFGLINNKGDLTINGTGAITLTATQNRGWTAYSSVISNQVGGKLTVNGGTIQHLGGTSMAWGIDNLTNGKGTYAETIINGGVVKSKYIAIRQFLNGVEADNILTVNGGTLEGETASLYFQDPSKNANTGTLNVLDGTLAGDVYLDVTAGSTEWPVEVYIAKDALGQNDIHADNVPAEAAALVEYDTFWQVEQKNLAELTIEDACEEYINKIEKNVGVLTYERYFDDTEWQTIVLPFDVPVANLKEQFEVAYIYNASYKGKQATIDYVVIDENSPIETLRANYPYLIKAKATGWNNIIVENAKLMPTNAETLDCSSIFEKFSFIGNYATVAAPSNDGMGYFNLTSGAWSRMETVNPFRFYMQIKLRNGGAFEYPTEQIRMRRVDENGNADTTGIDGIDAENAGDFIFDLHGRRVLEPLKGGLYIINGKKVLF